MDQGATKQLPIQMVALAFVSTKLEEPTMEMDVKQPRLWNRTAHSPRSPTSSKEFDVSL